MRVDSEALAGDAIREVGPGGVFLDSAHTGGNYRGLLYFPAMFRHGAWDLWIQSGRRTLLDKARDRAAELLRQQLDPVLPDDRVREIETVVREAELDLLGTTTGVSLCE